MNTDLENTTEVAEQAIQNFLAKCAGRSNEATVPRSNREPFGNSINLHRRHPEHDARFSEIGYHWNGFNTDRCFQNFVELSERRQLRVLRTLLNDASKHLPFYSALGELLDRLVCSGGINSTARAQIYAKYAELPSPPSKGGPNKAARDALVLNLLHILTGPEIRLNAKRGETSECKHNACYIIAKVFASEFPTLNLSYDAVRGIWDKRSR